MSTATPPPTPSDTTPDGEAWTVDELDAAYQRALAALEAVDSEIIATAEEFAPESSPKSEPPSTDLKQPAAEELPESPAITAAQVIEACLFVGGTGLTAGKLASVLKGDYTPQFVEETIETINRRYRAEGRPYEIRLGEGGYRLVLREEYERLRHKVYGLGPREVRLSQDALEVLALVAYHQPLSEAGLAELGKPQAGTTLRQLLRRDLLAVQRAADDPKTPLYVTTQRFLSLFGLGSLEDLPRPETLTYK